MNRGQSQRAAVVALMVGPTIVVGIVSVSVPAPITAADLQTGQRR